MATVFSSDNVRAGEPVTPSVHFIACCRIRRSLGVGSLVTFSRINTGIPMYLGRLVTQFAFVSHRPFAPAGGKTV